MSTQHRTDANQITTAEAVEVYLAFENHLKSRLWGREHDAHPGTIQLLLNAFFANGHILFEDFPGSGKSYMATTMAEMIHDDIEESKLSDGQGRNRVEVEAYKRIQCTPDLMPSDVTGYMKLDKDFVPGPVFAYFLLIDEINRTSPKVQSSLLEAMAERAVTVDGHRHKLGDLFFVIATMNPLDRIGTYELPAAQLDRFLFKRTLRPINQKFEARILADEALGNRPDGSGKLVSLPQRLAGRLVKSFPDALNIFGEHTFKPLKQVSVSKINAARHCIGKCVDVHDDLVLKIIEVADKIHALTTGDKPVFKSGSRPSVRSMQKFVGAVKVRAFIEVASGSGSSGSIPDSTIATPRHFRDLAVDLLRHRVIPENARMTAKMVDDQLTSIVNDCIPE